MWSSGTIRRWVLLVMPALRPAFMVVTGLLASLVGGPENPDLNDALLDFAFSAQRRNTHAASCPYS